MANERLKQITTKAKQLYKSGKYKKWTDAIKAASKQLPAAKKSSKKKASVKKVAGWKKGNTAMVEYNEKKVPGKKNVRIARKYDGAFMHFTKISGISEKARYSIVLDNLENDLYEPFAPESSMIKAKSILKKWAVDKAIDRYKTELSKGKEVLVYVYDKHKATTAFGYSLYKKGNKILKKSL
jgi:hypothetical protein